MARSGLYVPLDVNFGDDDKMISITAEAQLVYIRGLMLSKRTRSAGFIHRRQIGRLTEGFRCQPDALELAAELVQCGAWMEIENGWLIAAWADHNASEEQLAAARARDAARKRTSRRTATASENVRADTDDVQESPTLKRSEDKTTEEKQPRVRLSTDERNALLRDAAEIIMTRRGRATEALTKNHPSRWLEAAVIGTIEELKPVLLANPAITDYVELAALVEPPPAERVYHVADDGPRFQTPPPLEALRAGRKRQQ